MPIKIKNWDSLYETHETRKLKRLNWVPIPNRHDGAGFRRVAARKDSCEIFSAWILLLQIASKSPERGILPDSPGDAAFKTGYPERIFSKAYDVLSSKEIGWIETCGNLIKIETSGDFPDTAGELPGRREGNGRERNGREGNGTDQNGIGLPVVPDFLMAAWNEWEQHRNEKKKPITPLARKKQISALVAMGEERAIVAINHSIANGWTGIFEPKSDKRKQSSFGPQEFTHEDAKKQAAFLGLDYGK